jgi:outer membrane cobalamin receptor
VLRPFFKCISCTVLLSLALPATGTGAEESVADEHSGPLDALYNMSIEELMEVTIVTSASRLPQGSGELSSPVTVLTAEDIHHSGLTSIPQILRFACGVDVLEIDRRRYALGIHGLHETFSDRTTLLIDGRLADNPVYGGPDFEGLPLMIEDIERIEVVRSPGGAAWGANALTGVVNIVTKKPPDVSGTMARTTLTEFGDSYTQIRWADKYADWSWRVSVGYEDVKSSEDAIDADYESFVPSLNALIGFNTFEARDFARNQRIDTEALYDFSEATRLSLGIGYTHIDAGRFELGGYYPQDDIREDHIRSYAKLDHRFDNGDSGYLQWSGKFWNGNWPMAGQFDSGQNELEGQYNFAPKDRHHTSIGASFRWDYIDADVATGDQQQVRISGEPLDEYNTGLFAIDRWEMSDRWTLEGQIRGDYYSGTRADWSGRLTALYALDQAKKHVLRFAAAKAFSTPLPELRKASTTRIPMGGGLYLLNVIAPGSLENEETYCLETGYTATLSKNLSLRIDTYYQQFNKLIGYRRTTNIFSQVFAVADNINGADAWGGEVELAVNGEWGKISSWYSYNAFEPDRPQQDFEAFLPAKHKMGMRYQRHFLPGWTFNANYSYYDTTPGNPATGNHDVNASNRLDLIVSKTFNKDKGEIMIGVRDVFDKIYDPIRQGMEYASHEVPGRCLFVSLLLKY